ncbi:MAG: ATP-dependent sacrificial sulfur transferase LarE [Candidatus Nanopelagicales bacterium]
MPVEDANADPVDRLLDGLRTYPGLLIAFSAGVDSAFLLAAALRALGSDRVLAVTAVSNSLPAAELDYARRFAAEIGARHLEASTHELDRDGYRENSTDRCYFCKAELMDVVSGYLDRLPHGAQVATGTNADDLVAGFRPGIRAAAQRGAVTPLADAGLTKPQIRAAAQAWGLTVWDKPQAACLSSRIAYGIQISPARLARVEQAEIAVRDSLSRHGIHTADLRVRDLGDIARIEIDQTLAQGTGPWRDDVVGAVRAVGFAQAHIDPRGFRSGSMNEARPSGA